MPTDDVMMSALPDADPPLPPPPSSEALRTSVQVLQWLAENPEEGPNLPDLGHVVARAYKRVRKQRRISAAHAREATSASASDTRCCYICQRPYPQHEGSYPLLCPACAMANQDHRTRRGDLRGRRAVVTGGRIKVGYQVALKLLRDGATVVATTRFPLDAARRYAAEPDFAQWKDRLVLYDLDLRDLRALQRFVTYVHQQSPRLDIVVNNAAQTIRRPAAYFAALRAQETSLRLALDENARSLLAGAPSPETPGIPVIPSLSAAPPDLTDSSLDAAPGPGEPAASAALPSTWTLPLEHIEPMELAEVMVINAMAPFLLARYLEPLLRQSLFPDRYIVNVTSAEGQFDRSTKGSEHPHTNMAKAALNMLTRTAAERCAASGIYINSVDPGWITHMSAVDPADHTDDEGDRAGAFVPPLDAVDGAARIYDPILRGLAGTPVFGLLLKDYQSAPW